MFYHTDKKIETSLPSKTPCHPYPTSTRTVDILSGWFIDRTLSYQWYISNVNSDIIHLYGLYFINVIHFIIINFFKVHSKSTVFKIKVFVERGSWASSCFGKQKEYLHTLFVRYIFNLFVNSFIFMVWTRNTLFVLWAEIWRLGIPSSFLRVSFYILGYCSTKDLDRFYSAQRRA